MEYKEFEGVKYKLSDGVYLPIVDNTHSSRMKSWITLRQITSEFPEFYDKIEEIFAAKEPGYSQRAQNFATSLMEYLEKWGWLSWKQFDSIWRISSTYADYIEGKDRGFYSYQGVVSISTKGIAFTMRNDRALPKRGSTDKEMDRFYKDVFGHKPRFEEEETEGMTACYRDDGSRYFALPTGDENLWNFRNFKGLSV